VRHCRTRRDVVERKGRSNNGSEYGTLPGIGNVVEERSFLLHFGAWHVAVYF